MPDECKIAGDVVGSYRKYYILYKQRFATWKRKNRLVCESVNEQKEKQAKDI